MAVFNEDLGAGTRGWFCGPMPGSPFESYEDGNKWPSKLPKTYEVEDGDEEVKRHVDEAVKNFALLVMEPVKVERVEYGPSPHRRTQYERQERGWKESIVAP